MIRSAVRLSGAAARAARSEPSSSSSSSSSSFYQSSGRAQATPSPSSSLPPSTRRWLHDGITSSPKASANPVALQMIDYALSLARSQRSDEACAQGMLVLEQCLSSLSIENEDIVTHNSKGMVLLAMSNLLLASGNYDDAIEKLQSVQDLGHSSLGVRVAAMDALVGLNLELGRDDTSAVLADKCLKLLRGDEPKGIGGTFELVEARAKAVNGLVDLVRGLKSAESFFQGLQDNEQCVGAAALSVGEFLHVKRNFPLAKDIYQKVIKRVAENKDFTDLNSLAACNMSSEQVVLGATCALGQLEAHMGNFAVAEETLTEALNKAEQVFGSRHPKVGVVLTCLALMFRHKAIQEYSSSLLIQEGLYRRAIELLKAPSLDSEGGETLGIRRDIIALTRGGYAEALRVQENRRSEGEKMKRWAEAAWRNRRMSLAEALKFSEPLDKVPVIDARTGRAL